MMTKTRNVGRSFETRLAKARELNDRPELMSIPEAATVIRVGRSKMWSMVWDGTIESVFVGRQRRVVASSLHKYIASLRGN
jgi:excisionase family DNA binding protein